MKLTGLFKRGAACLCTAAILMGGISAFALSPALPDEPAPAELSVTNAVSEAQLRSALSQLTVTYDSEAEGWQIDSPYEEASMEKASCGLYPYLFVTNDDPTVYLSLGMTYFGNKKLDMKSVRVETEDNYYDFTCDEEFIGGYDNDLKSWFDYELFDMDDSTSWLNEWLAAKSVTATFTGRDGSTKTYTLTKDNVQAIRDILDAGATCSVTQVEELAGVLNGLKTPPKLVVTDSQAFGKVKQIVPESIKLTSFSILFARYKGVLETAVRGAAAIENLKASDRILISEGCTHHRQCGDIGTVKLPAWIHKHTGKDFEFEFTSGGGFPEDLSPYALIVHCGGCMLNEREMQFRQSSAEEKGVPYTNYGILIAYINGILKRSLAPFDEYTSMI